MVDTRNTDTGSAAARHAPGVWKMHLVIFLIGLLIAGIVGYGFYAGNRISTVDARLVRAAMKIKLEASTTNLVIEGLLGEGFAADFEPVWEPLDAAFQEFRSVFEASKQRVALLPFRAGGVNPADVENLSLKLSEF